MERIDLKQELILLLEKEIGFTGKFILEKQCRNLDIDPDKICYSDLEPLARKVTLAIRSYTGEKRADEIKKSIMEYHQALEVVEHSLASDQTPEELIEAEITIASKKLAVNMYPEARDALIKARELLGKVDTDNSKSLDSRISRLLGRVLSTSGETLEDAIEEYQRSIFAGMATGQHYDVALSWNGIGSISWRLGQHQRALDCYDKALKAIDQFAAESRNDKQKKQGAVAIIKSSLGNVYLDLLDYESAIKYNEEAIEDFRSMGNDAEVGRIYNNLARVYEEMGNYPRAMDRYERAIKYCGESGSLRMQGWALTNLASTFIENKRLEDARIHLEKAEHILANFTDAIANSKLHCMWGKYYREKGVWQNSTECFEKSIEAVINAKSPDYLAIAREEFGIMYVKKKDKQKAKELLDKALEWYIEKKDTVRIPKIEKLLADLNN